MACAVKVPGLVKSRGLVVGSVDPGQRRQYRGLVRAVPLASMSSRLAASAAPPAFSSCFSSVRPMSLAAHSGRSCRARMCSGSACSTPGCRALSSAGRSRPWPRSALPRKWVIVLHRLGTMTDADTTLNVAWMILPLIVIAEGFSWYAVLTRNYLGNTIENSIWAVAFFIIGIALCRLLPEFDGPVRVALAMAIVGIAGYLAFLMAVDVPMYFRRWRAEVCRWPQAAAAAGGSL